MSKDLYQVLGIDRNADQPEIRRAYRLLARRFHPDLNPGEQEAEQRFKQVVEAYRVLGDKDLRLQYDHSKSGHTEHNHAEHNHAAGDVFREIFGSKRAHRTSPAHRSSPSARDVRDLRYGLDLDFVEAALGIEKKIMVPRSERCPECRGTGAQAGSVPLICPTCNGRGSVTHQQGFFDVGVSCSRCQGDGQIVPQNCSACEGQGVQVVPTPVQIEIPPGVESGTRLRLRGEGQSAPKDGKRSDLYVIVNILPHPFFQRDGSDVIIEVPITVPLAVLGGEIDIPTLAGRASLKIPAGTQSGHVFRRKGQGIPARGSAAPDSRGDLRIRVFVDIATELKPEQRRLYQALAALDDKAESGQVAAYLENMRKCF